MSEKENDKRILFKQEFKRKNERPPPVTDNYPIKPNLWKFGLNLPSQSKLLIFGAISLSFLIGVGTFYLIPDYKLNIYKDELSLEEYRNKKFIYDNFTSDLNYNAVLRKTYDDRIKFSQEKLNKFESTTSKN